jgi:hypothetical protein
MLPAATSEHYRAQQRRIVTTLALVRREWAGMGTDFDASWAQVGPKVLLLTASSRLGAARAGASYVAGMVDVEPEARVGVQRLAATASDGRSLASLLEESVIVAKSGVRDGLDPSRALVRGGSWLDMAVHTQVADASRDAQRLAVLARPKVQFIRVANTPCCQRCAVLSGRLYRFSQGFQRHPRCDCFMLPTTTAKPDAERPMIGPEDVKDLTRKQREAIDAGHDFNKVVNDYQRGKAWHLPPTRVERITADARSRAAAVDRLSQEGLLAA